MFRLSINKPYKHKYCIQIIFCCCCCYCRWIIFGSNYDHEDIFYDAFAQDENNITIKTTKLTDSLYMLKGSGGNILVSIGQDGVFMVDDQFAPLTVKIKDAISKITDKPIKFVINTHWHPDHTGGNENLGETGVIIVSHENVKKD